MDRSTDPCFLSGHGTMMLAQQEPPPPHILQGGTLSQLSAESAPELVQNSQEEKDHVVDNNKNSFPYY
jgi:hypothetical protein